MAENDFDRARFFANLALETMAERRIPPTPHNFSVWFAHHSGIYPELSRSIEILISNNAEFTVERNAELYERLIGIYQIGNPLPCCELVSLFSFYFRFVACALSPHHLSRLLEAAGARYSPPSFRSLTHNSVDTGHLLYFEPHFVVVCCRILR